MTIEMIIVLGVLGLAVLLFATEWVRIDMAALVIMAILLFTGILSPEEGVSGLSNPAVVTIAAMFVISTGVFKTGAVNKFGIKLAALGKKSFFLAFFLMMIIVSFFSAFINNTAVVAVFLPIVLNAAKDMEVSPSKLLIPLSFASLFGGACTLVGTSTNILVSTLAAEHGEEAFGMFEFTKMGIVFFIAGTIYMLFIGKKLLPAHRPSFSLTKNYNIGEYMAEVIVDADSKMVGEKLKDTQFFTMADIEVIRLIREKKKIKPQPDMQLMANDTLLIKTSLDTIQILKSKKNITLKGSIEPAEEKDTEHILFEMVVTTNAPIINRTLKELKFRQRYDAAVLALRHRGQLIQENINSTPLRAGDVLLVQATPVTIDRFRENRNFLIASEIGTGFKPHKIAAAVIIVAGMVAAISTGLLPVMSAALAAGMLMIITGCINLKEAYDAIDWKILFLLVGVLSLGTAMEKTGTAVFITGHALGAFGEISPFVMISIFYLMTSVLTELISNNAVAVLLVPIAITTAADLGVDPRPFLFAVTFAASASFMTPIGYQTNTLVYGAGNYTFKDFLKVGVPLNLLFWLIATFLIPYFWPF